MPTEDGGYSRMRNSTNFGEGMMNGFSGDSFSNAATMRNSMKDLSLKMRPDYTYKDIRPSPNEFGGMQLNVPSKQTMDLPNQGHSWPPTIPNFSKDPPKAENPNSIFVKPNIDYVT
jgi:hypothetical protein